MPSDLLGGRKPDPSLPWLPHDLPGVRPQVPAAVQKAAFQLAVGEAGAGVSGFTLG